MQSETFFSKPTAQVLERLLTGETSLTQTTLPAGANVNEIGTKGITPIIYAVIKLNQSAVEQLLKLGADPNPCQDDGYNALTAAYELSTAKPGIMKALIRSGKCDLNVIMPDDEPMLYYLIASGKTELLKEALNNGANPSARTKGDRLLVIAAAILEEYGAVNLLLDAGASAKAVDAAGTSLLEFVKTGPSQKTDPGGEINRSRLLLMGRLH